MTDGLAQRIRASDEASLAHAKAKWPHHTGALDCVDCGAEVGIYRALMMQRNRCSPCEISYSKSQYTYPEDRL
jgi:ribosomal protein S14